MERKPHSVDRPRHVSCSLWFTVRTACRYRLRVLATAAPDYGVVRVKLDDNKAGPEFNLYAGRVCPSGSLELGTVDLAVGRHRLHFAAVAKPAGSTGFSFGLDAIDLMPLP